MKYIYTAIIHEEDGVYYASVPDLDGCITTGNSLSDAIEQISDALSAFICSMEDHNEPVPTPREQSEIPRASTDVCTLVRVDSIAYRALTDTRSVRKNVSLPAWMATMADKLNINCSKLLQDALQKQFG